MSDPWELLLDQHAAFEAPFICNIEFTYPSRFPKVNQKVIAKNINHIEYIGTRSGVETLDEENSLVSSVTDEEFNIEKYLNYVDNRPGSHGLFSASDEHPDVKAIQNEIAEHKGVVWRIVLSLTEEDAKRLDYTTRATWETTLRATVPEAMAKMGIGETNLRWVAAFHQEAGHPHVHISVWEKEPKRRLAKLSSAEIKDIKKVFQNVVYAEERTKLFQQKTMARDLINDLSKSELSDIVQLMREIQDFHKEIDLEVKASGFGIAGVSPMLHPGDQREIASQLKEIASLMPDRGRIALKYMSDDVKESVKATTQYLMTQPAFHDCLRRYYAAVESMTKQYSFKEVDISTAIDNARKDIEKRVSQVVLRAAAESKKNVFVRVNPEKAKVAVNIFSQAIGKPFDNQGQRVVESASEVLRRFGYSVEEQKQIFKEWTAKADLRVGQSNIDGIIERVNLQTELEPIEREKEIAKLTGILKLSGKDDIYITNVLENLGLQPEGIQESIKSASALEKESSVFFMKENDWERFTGHMGVKLLYPWELKENTTVLPEHREQVLQEFKQGILSDELGEQERGYTAYCMTVALKQMHVPASERSDIIEEFALRNNVTDIKRILQSIDKIETNYLRNETWKRVAENLNVELKYPWKTEEVMEVNPEIYTSAVKSFKTTTNKLENIDDIRFTAESYANFLRNDMKIENIEREIVDWANRTGNLSESQTHDLDLFKKRNEDIRIMSKQFSINDPIQDTVSNFTKVLVAAGLDKENVDRVIKEWNVRSGANIDLPRLDKIITAVDKSSRESAMWGRPPYVSRKNFKILNETLQTDAEYIWEGTKGGRQAEPVMRLAKGLWKSVFKAIDQERMKAHAQGEMLKRQQQRQRQRELDRQQGDD
jgi:hypothetical protein